MHPKLSCSKLLYLYMAGAIFGTLILVSKSFAEKPGKLDRHQNTEYASYQKIMERTPFVQTVRRLDLSEQQWTKIKTTLKNHRIDTKTQRERLATLKGEVLGLINNFNDTTAQGLTLQMGKILGEIEYSKIALRASIYQTLTPDQREKLGVMAFYGKN